MQLQNKKAVVLLSGGQDSTTCLFWAKRYFTEVVAVSFDYNQKHGKELEMAQKIAKLAAVEHRIIDLKSVFLSNKKSSLLNKEIEHSSQNALPNSFVRGRNLVFFSAALAAFEEVNDFVLGVCQTDYSGYPDCRAAFIDALEGAATNATDERINIYTPLMHATKAETWKLAKELGILKIIIEHTLTDYNGDTETLNEWGFGKEDNPASTLRANGYREAKAKGWLEDGYLFGN